MTYIGGQGSEYGRPQLVAEQTGLVVNQIGKSFRRRPVVRAVSLQVRRGEAVGLLGPNGAGKTTCFYMITGLIPADSGQILLDGHDITVLPMYRRARLGIGYLPQEASIFRGLTVEQNLLAVAELVAPDRQKRQQVVDVARQRRRGNGVRKKRHREEQQRYDWLDEGTTHALRDAG